MERSLRLRKDYDVRAARSGGKSYPAGPLVAKIRPNALDPVQNRYTAVASKKVGKAHDRNRCKRLVREALRHLHPRLTPGHDIVIVIRGGAGELTGYDIAFAALERIFKRAKILGPAPTETALETEQPLASSQTPEPAASPAPEPAASPLSEPVPEGSPA